MTNKDNIKNLADAVFDTQERFYCLGMTNTYGLTFEERKRLNQKYEIARHEMLVARKNLDTEQNL